MFLPNINFLHLQFLGYSPDKNLYVKVTAARSNQGHTMMLHTYRPQPMSLSGINFLYLTVSEIQSRQEFIGQGHYGKVKSRSHHDMAHLHPLTNVPTKYQLPTPYGLRDIVQTRFYRSRSLAHLQPLTNVPTIYKLSTPYGFQDIARTRFYSSKSLQQGQIKVTA